LFYPKTLKQKRFYQFFGTLQSFLVKIGNYRRVWIRKNCLLSNYYEIFFQTLGTKHLFYNAISGPSDGTISSHIFPFFHLAIRYYTKWTIFQNDRKKFLSTCKMKMQLVLFSFSAFSLCFYRSTAIYFRIN
jgi:hypothetical protein